MGTRHWPDDADEAVEKLEARIKELEGAIERMRVAGEVGASRDE